MTRLGPALATAALVVAGCGLLASPTPSPEPPPPTSGLLASPTPTPEPPPPTSSCAEAIEPPDAPVYAYFHCADAAPGADPRPVPRDAHAADPVSRLEAAMIGLVAGPSDEERAAGYSSFFSEATELAVRGVAIGDDGTAIVDFEDIRPFMNNASTSAASATLLAQLNATVFQIDEVTAVEYRIEGSCDLFWEWLQGTCTVVPRP